MAAAPSEPKPPRAPAGLGKRGRAYWRQVVADLEFTPSEAEVLREVCRLLDDLELLHDSIEAHGVTVKGSMGQLVAHPALAEQRQCRAQLTKLMDALDLPAEDEDTADTAPVRLASIKGRRAAEARWRPHNTAKDA